MLRVVGGKLRGHGLSAPKGLDTRPTSSRLREAVFNICQHLVDEADFLDIFAGSGAMGIEALSRGARSATFIDKDRRALKCIKDNISKCKLNESAKVISGDVMGCLKRLAQRSVSYDLIYVDPPYGVPFENGGESYAAAVLRFIDEGKLLKPGGSLFCEESKDAELDKCSLSQLELKSQRPVGRSVLWQFVFGGET